MEKNIILNNQRTEFWIDSSGRLHSTKTKRWLKGGINKGYHFYSLYFKGKQYILYTHRVVAEYFVKNDNPQKKTIVHHLDGNRLNNNYLNLQWVSPVEHNETIKRNGQLNTKREKPKKVITVKDYGKVAQFRDTPYYCTEEGKVLNLDTQIELKQNKSGNYYRVHMRYGINKKILVHRAIWEAFHGKIPKGMEVDHINNNSADNALSNLQLLSHKDNLKKRNIDYSYAKNNFNR